MVINKNDAVEPVQPVTMACLLQCLVVDNRSFSRRLAAAYMALVEGSPNLASEAEQTVVIDFIDVFCQKKVWVDLSGTSLAEYEGAVFDRFLRSGGERNYLRHKRAEVLFVGTMMSLLGEDSPAYPDYLRVWEGFLMPETVAHAA